MRQFRDFDGHYQAMETSNTEYNPGMKSESEVTQLNTMATVNDLLELCQGSQMLGAIQKESRAQIKQMTATGYISDTEQIIQESRAIMV